MGNAPLTETPKCSAATNARAIPLPVIIADRDPHHPRQSPKPRPSRNGPRRAAVLGLIHLAVAIHVTLWLTRGGETLAPVEPSESMYTLETGVINAGIIFFAVAILSTFLFGRFFCGWGCHVVALQDACAWMLKKIGIRPKPFRSRLLVYVPLLAAFYMFFWPTLRREVLWPALRTPLATAPAGPPRFAWPEWLDWLGPVQPFPGFSVDLMVPDFWATFPGPWIAVPFLFICGFACVYFLGAKGYCTYGCPYGGVFGPVDRFSPGRILVDHNKCESCGHCTAACTSNVRVHEEIRDFGMVVDPGCMKCLDCVSVCPNDALRFGFGAPPILKSRKRGRATPAPDKPRKTYDLARREEIAVAIAFAAGFFGSRQVYNAIPLLMALGISGCVAYIAHIALRLVSLPNVRLHNFTLRSKGRLRPAAFAFIPLAILTFALTAQSLAVHRYERLAQPFDNKVTVPTADVFRPQRSPLPPEQKDAAEQAIRLYTRASSWRTGGIGLASTPAIDIRLAWLRSVLGDYAGAEADLRRVEARGELKEPTAMTMATIIGLQKRDASDFVERLLDREPTFHNLRGALAQQYLAANQPDKAKALYESHLKRYPDSGIALAHLGAIQMMTGETDKGLDTLAHAAAAEPNNPEVLQQHAVGLFTAGKPDDAVRTLEHAAALAPRNPTPLRMIAEILQNTGRPDDAAKYLQQAQERDNRNRTDPAPAAYTGPHGTRP